MCRQLLEANSIFSVHIMTLLIPSKQHIWKPSIGSEDYCQVNLVNGIKMDPECHVKIPASICQNSNFKQVTQ